MFAGNVFRSYFFSSRRRHTRCYRDWSSDVCSSDLDWQIPLGRRFRALKLWLVIRHYGAEGLRYHVRRHVALAQELASWVRDDPEFELAAPVPLNLVCFRHRMGDDATQA